jgi:D-inositol-3-phosphate glycosyltransferase
VTYTRADAAGLPREVLVEPGHLVVHIEAGPHHLPKEALTDVLDEFTDAVAADIAARGGVDVIHANYWMSGIVAHRLKHRLDIPFVTTFHTLARVKASGGDVESIARDRAEAEVIGCADAVCVSCDSEADDFRRHYGDPAGRLEIVSPGVEHAFFTPGDRTGARRAIGAETDSPLIVFVGRIQPLKGPDVAIRALALSRHRDARLIVVGGASGPEGGEEFERMVGLVDDLGLGERVEFRPPQAHHLLSTYYRAADVVVVPSRSESFGLVALEASACGTPVVASAVGGLLSLVDDGESGFLVDDRRPASFATSIDAILDDPAMATSMSMTASLRSSRYTWRAAAERLRATYRTVIDRSQVVCQ